MVLESGSSRGEDPWPDNGPVKGHLHHAQKGLDTKGLADEAGCSQSAVSKKPGA